MTTPRSTPTRRLTTLIYVGLLAVTLSACAQKTSPTAGDSQPTAPVATVPSPTPAATTAATTAASVPAAAPAVAAIDGRWNGRYSSTSSPGSDGAFEVTYTTSANGQLSGSIQIHDTPCVSTGTVKGRLQGTSITFGAVHGAQTIAFTGTLSGSAMSGTYDAPDCGHGKGTWTATRA